LPVKLKYGSNRPKTGQSRFSSTLWRGLLIAVLACLALGAATFGFFYFHYKHVVDDRLAAGPIFASVSQIYAAPREVRPGQKLTAAAIAGDLRRAGYNSNPQLGTFRLNDTNIFIKPGPESYHSTDGATINTAGGVVQKISAENGVALAAYDLEPQLITALSEDKGRAKRRMVTYDQIPLRMVQAVTAIEDRRFFEHSGVNFVRIGKCAVEDILSQHLTCGGSTLTQQLARGFFLSPDKKFVRKFREIMITFQL
jgi:penicillin-binding protein 1B